MYYKNHPADAIDCLAAFIDFLHHRGCLDAFIANTLGSLQSLEPRVFLAALFHSTPERYVRGAFLWPYTSEGSDYWRQVDKAWAKYRSKHYIS